MNAQAKNIRGDVSQQIDDLRTQISDLASSLSTYVERDKSTLAAIIADEVKKLSGDVNSKLSNVGAQATHLAEAAQDKAVDLQKQLADEVRERPLRALAVTAGIGLVIGMLSRSK